MKRVKQWSVQLCSVQSAHVHNFCLLKLLIVKFLTVQTKKERHRVDRNQRNGALYK